MELAENMRGLITAMRTLTIIRIPGKDAENLASALPWFPVIGALIGSIAAIAVWGVGEVLGWTSGAAVLCVTISTILTGGLHLDGLADVFDSFGGSTREKKLEIMKDPRIGSFGVMAVAICLIFKTVAIARIAHFAAYVYLVIPFVVSRVMQVGLATFLPYARTEEGTGKRFIDGARPFHFVASFLLAAVICVYISPVIAAGAFVATAIVTVLLGYWFRRVFGGLTGDMLGMASEVVETIILIGLACLLSWFFREIPYA